MTQPADDDQPFRHYSMKHRVVAWISTNLFDSVTYTVRYGLLKGMKRKGGLGWLPEFVPGRTPTAEHAFWTSLNLKDMVVYDVGAFQGLLTLFFAKQARVVISYEPNSANHARLMSNLKLNRVENVIVRKLGVGAELQKATMVASPLMGGGASIQSETIEGLRKSNLPVVSEDITVVRLDDDIRDASLPAPDFLKIDIEGLELAALMGARNTILAHRPQIFLELHGETMNLKRKNVREVVGYLEGLGYRDIRHIESGSRIDSSTAADIAPEGHLHCVADTP